ncbi:MAG: FAD-dependent monooxygenase [Lewinella sp.]|nr:FAD-dependent monooxygenase [Lewinella sp.]
MKQEKILIVGAGLCGTLCAIRLAQRGYEVELHEKRPDLRQVDLSAGRSINLALSDRGLRALRMVGLEEEALKSCIPMYGRLIHAEDGNTWFSRYSGRQEDHINSISRPGLNAALLHKADTYDNLQLHFNSKCVDVDLQAGRAIFQQGEQRVEAAADIVIGTDGAGSAVRRAMMGHTTELLFNYSQHFLRHGYKELTIPAAPGGEFRIEKNALHIWPRTSYMIIALPNLDGSFTVTMFFPFAGEKGFEQLDTPEKVNAIFAEEFADLHAHLPDLSREYFEHPVGTLGTIKCYPWQAYGKALLMGDAAHAIVPFYGQGMNASFEDVWVLDQIWERYEGDWSRILPAFAEERKPDADAIADLALDNFIEMRDQVDDEAFIRKRKLEMQLEQHFPEYYSKYSLVTFNEDLSYAEAMRRGRAQDQVLLDLCAVEPDEAWALDEVLAIVRRKTEALLRGE